MAGQKRCANALRYSKKEEKTFFESRIIQIKLFEGKLSQQRREKCFPLVFPKSKFAANFSSEMEPGFSKTRGCQLPRGALRVG